MGDDDEHNKRAPTAQRTSGKRNKRRRRNQSNDANDPPTSVSATDQQQQILSNRPQREQEYYDYNRNLMMMNRDERAAHEQEHEHDFLGIKTNARSETLIGPVDRGGQQRCRENESPIESTLSTQSGDSAPQPQPPPPQQLCHCELYGDDCQGLNSSGASSSDHSTGRMSQTSLAAAATIAATTAETLTNEGSQQRAVKFQVGEACDLQQPVDKRQHTAITIQEQESCDAFLRSHEVANKTGGRSASLVRQLGRRVSLFPQTLARQMTWRDDADRRPARRMNDDLRRHSLPVPRGESPPLSPEAEEVNELSPLHSTVVCPADPPVPTTVAGVGGTITTVTRSKRKTAPLPRLVAKNGQVNLFLDNIDRRQYMRDLFTTMIDIKWRYNLMAAAFGFVFSWLFFACIWYLVLYFHNDLEHENDPNWSPCIVNVYSFPAALLFSIETQSTLGFGSRIISVECPGAILIFCSQLIFGVVVECLIVGMVFAKLSRPTKRSQTIMYSKYATVCLREGKMCLTFRVGDVRSKSHIIGATLRASLVSSKVTQEGELIPFYHHKLKVIIDDCKNSLLLIWPVTIVHVIDDASPFYKLNADELINFKFEIITVLEGTVESTGQSIQVRSSYLPSEVRWGYRFEPIVSTHGYGKYAQTIIDYNKFNRIVEVPTPKCSPLDYYADQAKLHSTAGANTRDTCRTTNNNNNSVCDQGQVVLA